MKLRQTHPIEVAAAKADISRATGYRIAQDPRLPSQKAQPRERRRPDPLEAIFDTEVVPLLKEAPGLRPVAIFEEILRRHPELSPGVRRTLERRITLRKVFYTVPSRLIGHRLRVRLHDDRLEVFMGGTHLLTLPRGRAHSDGRHDQVVNYRHVIHALRKKPMALLNLVYRDKLVL